MKWPFRWVSMTGVPLVLGHVEQHPLAEDAGHGHHAVDPAPALGTRPDDPLAAGQGGDALGHGDRLAAGGFDLGDDGLGHLALRVLAGHRHADVGHDHLGALGRGGQGDGPPDASAGAGDGHDLAVQECRHCGLLLILVVSRGPRRSSDARAPKRSAAVLRAVDRRLEPVLASPPGRRHPAPLLHRPPRTSGPGIVPEGPHGHRRRPTTTPQRRHGGWDQMGDLGFWALAHEHPEHLALVAPDGTEYTAGELLGRANQVVHGLRGLNLQPGDVVATLLPNGVEMFELYLAAPAGRLVPGADQPPPDRDRGGLHPVRLRGQGLRGPRAVRRRGPRRRRGGRAALVDLLRGGRHPRLRLLRPHARRPAHHRPGRPDHRRRHELHVGHHRQPEGRLPQAERAVPRGGRPRPVRHPLPVQHPAPGRQRPHRRARRSTTPRSCASRAPRSTSATPSW